MFLDTSLKTVNTHEKIEEAQKGSMVSMKIKIASVSKNNLKRVLEVDNLLIPKTTLNIRFGTILAAGTSR